MNKYPKLDELAKRIASETCCLINKAAMDTKEPAKMETKLNGKGVAFLFVACLIITVAEGFTLNKLWAWFIIPTFGGPLPGMIVCIGLGLVASTLRPTPMPADFDAEKAVDHILNAFCRLAITLAIGFVLSYFVWS